MYSSIPPRLRGTLRSTLVFGWVLVLCAGVASVLPDEPGAPRDLADAIFTVFGALLAASAAASAIGVVTDRYRVEWVAAWCAAAGATPHIFASWMEVAVRTLDADQALYPSALLVFLILRAQFCAAHAAKLRARHETTGSIHVAE